MSKVKQLSFAGKTVYCGIDVHKTNWKVNARLEGVEVAAFSQDPDPAKLKSYFDKNFPEAALKVAYEAGFCGFGAQRSLTALGVDCIVVNAADIPSSDKDRKRKNDKRDARKLGLELAKGSLKGIYIPDRQMEQARALTRQRRQMVKEQTRCVNRIKHLLMSQGVQVENKSERMSVGYIQRLQQLDCGSVLLKTNLHYALEHYLQIRKLVKDLTVELKKLSQAESFAGVQAILRTIGGVGLINGMVIQTEIGDIRRFRRLDCLCDYSGFVPDVYSSNDREVVRGISKRRNEFLREAIIESSWILIRKDPAMLMKYNDYRSRMNPNKAIVRIGKHLLSRIKFVWMNNQIYVNGITG
jgi:transposase